MGKHKLLLLDEKNMDNYTHNTIWCAAAAEDKDFQQ
jgi:hypothetical protein